MEIRKKPGFIRLILVCLFCTALFVTQLNTAQVVKGFGHPGYVSADTVSSGNLFHKKTAGLIEFNDVLGEETVGDVLLNITRRSTGQSIPLDFVSLKSIYLLIPFAFCQLRTVLWQEGSISRMFVIHYIHNSDGEKEAAGRLWQKE
ncbi:MULTISPECIES: hypothetical protein [Lacrimispora]|uniref:hypothetical protein n=1 Tax=Lacrimispora TaxID=2719231 RepID=UPI000BE3D5D6|nr:hypothetical protein [Lacrimispora amygdalina]MDK2966849.1 hypothetical protein [Lacrimispora sp.]